MDDADDKIGNNLLVSHHHNVSYTSWQDPKRGIAPDDTGTPCAIPKQDTTHHWTK